MKTDSKNKFETPDKIVTDCNDELPKACKAGKNSNSKSHEKKRDKTSSEVDNLDCILITQNVHVEKQRIKCVINLNTNLCDSKIQKFEDGYQSSIKRIVPKCFRSICQSAISDILSTKNRCCKHKPRRNRKHKHHKKCDKISMHCSESKSSKRKLKKKKTKKVVRDPSLSLSSVSLSPFVSDLTYEDIISEDSFSKCSDDELDTLIRRAKERERRMCVTPELCYEKPLKASTPQNVIELSSDEETLKLNESIHSLDTFVLEPQLDMACTPIASSDNIPSGGLEEYKGDNDVIIMNTVPTIDLTDTIPYNTKKASKHTINNYNNIERKTNIVNITTKSVPQHSEQNIVFKGKCAKIEPNFKCSKTSASFKPTECKPNVAQLDTKIYNVNLPCKTVYPPECNNNQEKKNIKNDF